MFKKKYTCLFELFKMETSDLRNAILKGFARLPGQNSILCCLRFSKIRALMIDVDRCVNNLVVEGLLESQQHSHRKPQTYSLSGAGKGFIRMLSKVKKLSPYEEKILDAFHQAEYKSARLQEKVLNFISTHKYRPSVLMIQEHIHRRHWETVAILCELVKTKDIECSNNQLLWQVRKESLNV